MNCVQLVGEVTADPVGRDDGFFVVPLTVPREGTRGREPGVVYVQVLVPAEIILPMPASIPNVGDRVSVVGYLENPPEADAANPLVEVRALRISLA